MKKSRIADGRDGWYTITPGDAQRLLDEQPLNRPLRESKAERFARDMAAGNWRPNGEPVILDEAGKILDGQGRCRSCVISGKPFETYVIHDVPRRFFTSVDTGQSRGGADTLALAGSANCVLAAAVCGLAIACADGSPTSVRSAITNAQISAFFKKNADRVNSAIEAMCGLYKSSPLSPSILTYVYMEAMGIDPQRAVSWANGIALGEGLSAGSPVLALRNRLIALRGDSHKMTRDEKLALAIKSWNAFVADRKVSQLKWNRRLKSGKNAEPFPTMAGAMR